MIDKYVAVTGTIYCCLFLFSRWRNWTFRQILLVAKQIIAVYHLHGETSSSVFVQMESKKAWG